MNMNIVGFKGDESVQSINFFFDGLIRHSSDVVSPNLTCLKATNFNPIFRLQQTCRDTLEQRNKPVHQPQ